MTTAKKPRKEHPGQNDNQKRAAQLNRAIFSLAGMIGPLHSANAAMAAEIRKHPKSFELQQAMVHCWNALESLKGMEQNIRAHNLKKTGKIPASVIKELKIYQEGADLEGMGYTIIPDRLAMYRQAAIKAGIIR